jgi:PBP1b-binding outer membrane lipoprotein LpoB
MTLRQITVLLISVALSGCTQAPPPAAQKQPAQEETKKESQKDDNIHIPHTGWAP